MFKLLFGILLVGAYFMFPDCFADGETTPSTAGSAQSATPTLDTTNHTVTPAPSLKEETEATLRKLTKTDRLVGDLILAETEVFQIKWLISSQQMMIEIKKAPYPEGKEKATLWLLSQGFRLEGLCLVDIFVYASAEVLPSIVRGDSEISGCKAK